MKLIFTIILLTYLSKVFVEKIFYLDIYPFIFSLLISVVLFQALSKKINKYLLLFVGSILLSFFTTTFINQNLSHNYQNMIFLYLLQPVAIIMLMRFKTIELSALNSFFVLKTISWTSIPLLIGCTYFYCVHLLGFPDPFEVFYIELTTAGSEVVLRNPSFMGSSLLLCGVALVQFLSSQYLYSLTNQNIYKLISMFALLSVLLSLSRRAILPILIYYFVVFILYPKRRGLKILMYSFLGFVAAILLIPDIFSLILMRIISIFDIVNDSSNVSRVKLMFEGLRDVILKPWGLGFGSLSSVGYTVEEVHKLDEARVTESAVITLLGEIGLLSMTIILLLLVKFLSVLKYPTLILFVFPLAVESVVGLGLLAPVVSFFTISFVCAIYYMELSAYKDSSTDGTKPKEIKNYELKV